MTPRSEFKMETRHTGGAHTNWAGIECGKCDADAWTQVRNGGWATREFRKQGWKIGNKPSQHRCPDCYGKAISQRRMIPDNPAIPPHIGVALLEDHVKKNLLDTSSLTHDLSGRGDVPYASSSDLVPPHPVHDPDTLIPVMIRIKAVRGGQPPKPGVTMFTRRDNATRSAQKFAGGTEGVSFFTYPLGEGWTWQHADKMSRADKDAYWERQALPTTKKGHPPKRLPNPTHEPKPAPIPVVEAKEEAPMTVVSLTQKEPPMPQHQADPKTQQTTYDPGVIPLADPPRSPTRDERSLIHDELTKAYDPVGQRYGGSDSDTNVAGRLNVPRAWVSDIRAMFFGDHDRNAAVEKKAKELDAAIELARTASTRLLEMASEADTLERSLVAARAKLDAA